MGVRRFPDASCGEGCRSAVMPDPDIVELNVGGVTMATSREVLTLVQGSQLADMFSHDHMGLRRDKDGVCYLDVHPALFAKILSFLRCCRMATPDRPAPLPLVPRDLRDEYDRIISEFGLAAFMYGGSECGPHGLEAERGEVFRIISCEANVDQGRLQAEGLVEVSLSSSAGAPAMFHEEALSEQGLFGIALENSYAFSSSCSSSWIRIRFLRHKVRVEGMRLRCKASDAARMSDSWDFIQGMHCAKMGYKFSWSNVDSGSLDVPGVIGGPFVNEVQWRFSQDFCIEQIQLFGEVVVDM